MIVLRLGHRIHRDKRLSTHVCLTARALGASRVYYSGQRDDGLESSVHAIAERWGGPFSLEHVGSWRKLLRNLKKQGYKAVHLTMYGLPVQKEIDTLQSYKRLLVIVGGEKVPPGVYELADRNVAVSSQPHSEVAALAVLLHELFGGKELDKEFKGKMSIVPQARGKKTVQRG